METITVKIDTKTKGGKAFKAMLEVLNKMPGVKIVEEKSPYAPSFVRMIRKREKSKAYTEIDTKDIWGSLGLK